MNNTYITALIESLEKKISVLDEIIIKNREQADLLKAEPFSFADFDRNTEEKSVLIFRLEKLDDGFESLYARVKEELDANRAQYADEIHRMQDMIREITDKQTSIQAQETRLKKAVEQNSARAAKDLKQRRSTSSAAQNYYQAMNKLGSSIPPQFMDRKK